MERFYPIAAAYKANHVIYVSKKSPVVSIVSLVSIFSMCHQG